MNFSERFRVNPGTQVRLQDVDPGYTARHSNRKDALAEIDEYRVHLREQQELLFADKSCSILIVLQALDSGGKDGTIEHVGGALNPRGCRVVGFKQPTPEELSHDFLWRVHRVAPSRGEVVIFNRSHYEDVLVVRVHDLVPKPVWSERYSKINAFEQELTEDATHILKFFLHISKEEQLRRFKDRLDDPTKQWKISETDYKERSYWDEYTEAYNDALTRCTTDRAPWYIIPADHKWFRNLAVSRIIVEKLKSLDLKYPPPSVDLKKIRKQYHSAKEDDSAKDSGSKD